MDPVFNKAAMASLQRLDEANSGTVSGKADSSSGEKFGAVLESKTTDASATSSHVAPERSDAATDVQRAEMTQKVDTFLKGISSDQKRIDSMMARLSNGGSASRVELIQMQAVSYRYAQRVDLVTKIVEKAAGGVKQAMNTQV